MADREALVRELAGKADMYRRVLVAKSTFVVSESSSSRNGCRCLTARDLPLFALTSHRMREMTLLGFADLAVSAMHILWLYQAQFLAGMRQPTPSIFFRIRPPDER